MKKVEEQAKLKELDAVRVIRGRHKGKLGVLVHLYADGVGAEVEFLNGETKALRLSNLEPKNAAEVATGFPMFFRHTEKPKSDSLFIRHDHAGEPVVYTLGGYRPPSFPEWDLSKTLFVVALGSAVEITVEEAERIVETGVVSYEY